MGLIIQHICLIFLFSSIFGIFRSILAISDWQSQSNTINSLIIDLSDDSCSANTSFPNYLCIIFCIFTFLLIIERVYATHNYRSYEYTSWTFILNRTCSILWLPLPFIILFNFNSFAQAQQEFSACELNELNKTIYQRNAWIFIVFFFNSIFCGIFFNLFRKNLQHELEYLKHHYSTLSIRFQMRENLATSLFMTKCNLLIAFCFFLPIVIDFYSLNRNFTYSEKMLQREVWYIPIIYLHALFPLFLLKSHPKIYIKFKKWWQNRIT